MNEGNRVPEIVVYLGIPDSTVERYIKQLKDAGFIEFIGDAPQTGGYYVTESIKQMIST